MKQALTLTTGALQLPVERDGQAVGILELRPDDAGFLEGFYGLLGTMEAQRKALEEALKKDSAPREALGAVCKVCAVLWEEIDAVFGKGTCQLVFGETQSLTLMQQFFEGVAEALRTLRAPRLAAYTAQDAGEVLE